MGFQAGLSPQQANPQSHNTYTVVLVEIVQQMDTQRSPLANTSMFKGKNEQGSIRSKQKQLEAKIKHHHARLALRKNEDNPLSSYLHLPPSFALFGFLKINF